MDHNLPSSISDRPKDMELELLFLDYTNKVTFWLKIQELFHLVKIHTKSKLAHLYK